MSNEIMFSLQPYFFQEKEKNLLSYGGLKASTFVYDSGVAALRLQNELGELVMLPYQGQQIWDARFFGRSLTMKSMFTQPNPTAEYLRTYGGFLIHCGAVRMGVPGEKDDHPLHGELPNAPYQTAELVIGSDAGGEYIGLTGTYQHTVAFSYNYIARPLVKLYAHSNRVPVSLSIKNLKKTPMDLMYLAHVNFKPVDNGRLIYSAPCTPQRVRVRSSIPSHIHPPEGYRDFLILLEKQPEKHHLLEPGLSFDPEVVFFIDYNTDKEGWAYTMQLHPDGAGDFIRHRKSQLDHGVRWICRTADQDALGMCLPATAEPEGYSAEKAKGNIKTIPALSEYTCEYEFGALQTQEAKTMQGMIEALIR